MFPIIDRKRTGIRLRRVMDERGLSVKDVQQYLELGSVQSVYHWLNGLSMPTIDNLYALSELFQMPIDDLVCGNRDNVFAYKYKSDSQCERISAYYERLNKAA